MNLPEKDGIGKLFAVLQLIVFLVLFIGIFLILCRFFHSLFLRILFFAVDYFAVSMFLYVVIKPLFERAETALRNKKS